MPAAWSRRRPSFEPNPAGTKSDRDWFRHGVTSCVTLEDGGPGPVLTDGRSLFVTERQRRQPGLVSIALDDGAVEWRWTLPAGTYDVLAVEGRLFLLGTGGLTAVS